jgi:hypothetical protein
MKIDTTTPHEIVWMMSIKGGIWRIHDLFSSWGVRGREGGGGDGL